MVCVCVFVCVCLCACFLVAVAWHCGSLALFMEFFKMPLQLKSYLIIHTLLSAAIILWAFFHVCFELECPMLVLVGVCFVCVCFVFVRVCVCACRWCEVSIWPARARRTLRPCLQESRQVPIVCVFCLYACVCGVCGVCVWCRYDFDA